MSLKARLQKLEGKAPRFVSEEEAMRHYFERYPEKNQLKYAFEVHTFLYGEAGFTQPPFDELVGRTNESTKQEIKKDSENGVDILSQPILKL